MNKQKIVIFGNCVTYPIYKILKTSSELNKNYDLKMLVKEMVEYDLKLAKKEKTLKKHGYNVLIPQEA